jgi:hypothetical protein
MKATATIVVRGRVGRHELLPGPWIDGLADSLQGAGAIAVAYKRDDGSIAHAKMIPGTLDSNEGAVTIDVELDDGDQDVQPAPHVAGVDRLQEIIGDKPLG